MVVDRPCCISFLLRGTKKLQDVHFLADKAQEGKLPNPKDPLESLATSAARWVRSAAGIPKFSPDKTSIKLARVDEKTFRMDLCQTDILMPQNIMDPMVSCAKGKVPLAVIPHSIERKFGLRVTPDWSCGCCVQLVTSGQGVTAATGKKIAAELKKVDKTARPSVSMETSQASDARDRVIVEDCKGKLRAPDGIFGDISSPAHPRAVLKKLNEKLGKKGISVSPRFRCPAAGGSR